MKIFDLYVNLLVFFGFFKAMNCKTKFKTLFKLIYRIIIKSVQFSLLAGLICRLVWKQCNTFDEYMETFYNAINVACTTIKITILGLKQDKLIQFKKIIDSRASVLQSAEEEHIHERYSHFIRFHIIIFFN